MNHTKHPTTNLMLGAPVGWDQSKLHCDALPVTRVVWDGVPAVVSYWVPTPEELAALNAGHAVQLSVIGHTMPPVALGVDTQPLKRECFLVGMGPVNYTCRCGNWNWASENMRGAQKAWLRHAPDCEAAAAVRKEIEDAEALSAELRARSEG